MPDTDLADAIRAYRTRHGYSLTGFARCLSEYARLEQPIDRGTVHRWEHRKMAPNRFIAPALRRLLEETA